MSIFHWPKKGSDTISTQISIPKYKYMLTVHMVGSRDATVELETTLDDPEAAPWYDFFVWLSDVNNVAPYRLSFNNGSHILFKDKIVSVRCCKDSNLRVKPLA